MNATANRQSAALEGLRARLGESGLLTAPAELEAHAVDQRRLYRGRPLAVALPATVAEVIDVVCWCRDHRVGLVPQGGNTSYCGGATPDASGTQLVLGLRRLNRIRVLDAANFSMTVEAGCVLARVREAASAADRFFPLHLGSEGSCQIGGNLATNAGGLNVLRFGMTRDLVLGIEAVLPDGRLCESLTALRKNNTGYDLKSLLIGSEGTLGVITAATLKLWPKMRATATAYVALRDLDAAIGLLAALRAAGSERLTSFELLPRTAIELCCRNIAGITAPLPPDGDWYVLCEISSSADEPLDLLLQTTLESAISDGLIRDAAIATSERQRQAFWALRESVPEAQSRAGPSIKHDIAVPIADLPAFVRAASQWVASHVPDGLLICYGHVGDGSLHFNISRIGADDAAFLAREPAIKRAIHDLVAQYGGSISAEHGIGRLKVDELARYADPVRLSLMRAIKSALDPLGIMNPGKLLVMP